MHCFRRVRGLIPNCFYSQNGIRNDKTLCCRNLCVNKEGKFENHLRLRDLDKKYKEGTVYKGSIRINAKNKHIAFTSNPISDKGSKDVIFESISKRNRALQNDIIGFELLPRDQWRVDKTALTKSLMIANPNAEEKPVKTEKGVDYLGHSYNVCNVEEKFLQKTAKVVGIFEKRHTRKAMGYAKVLDKSYAIFTPLDIRIPFIRIPLEQFPAAFIERPGDFAESLMVAHIDHWGTNFNNAVGTLQKLIGSDQQELINATTESILSEFDLDDTPFPETLELEIPDFEITAEEVEKRKEFDFRKKCVFTIDPATARDLDDACSIEDLGNGTYEVGVHIADVSHFVTLGSRVDNIAQRRTTSVYLVQKVIPMLPKKLCEVLCSLNPGVDRLSFSVVWIMNANGDIISTKFGKSLITSCCKMSYQHAQDMINDAGRAFKQGDLPTTFGGFTSQDISKRVNLLFKLSQSMRQKRLDAGSMSINQNKVSYFLNEENGMPIGIGSNKSGDSNKLIEEFMLQANISVAEEVVEHYPESAIIRNHGGPKGDVLLEAKQVFDAMEIEVDTSSSSSMQKALDSLVDENGEPTILNLVISSILARSMTLAMYICAGDAEEADYWHYGLSVPLYTHFTSPIRRYPDLIIHRQLQAILEGHSQGPMSSKEVAELAKKSSDKKYAAKRASFKSDQLFLWMFLKQQSGLSEKGVIIDIGSESIDVMIKRFSLQIRIWENKMGVSQFQSKIHKSVEVVWKANDEKGLTEETQQFTIMEEVDVKLTAGKKMFMINAEIARPDLSIIVDEIDVLDICENHDEIEIL